MKEDVLRAAEDSSFTLRQELVETDRAPSPVSYLVCEPLEKAGFINAFSTRTGGVSPLPANDLNLVYFSGDTAENVDQNRKRFLNAIDASDLTILTARQTHSSDRFVLNQSEAIPSTPPACDALLTRKRNLLLGIQTADCLPVLIGDPQSGAIAAVHAGWRGTAGRITERTLAEMMASTGANLRTAIAALGPTACADCYEVGRDVIDRYKKEFGYWKDLFINFKQGSKAHLDIRAANIQQLLFCGFTPDRIHVSEYCTMHHNDLFFSYRREGNGQPSKVGRLLSVIGKVG